MDTERVWAVGMMRDEEDVAYDVVSHLAAEGVDGIIVADNRSTDATRAMLDKAAADAPCPVLVLDDPEVGYFQSRKMTNLAGCAANRGAGWIVPFDADEIWYAHSDRLADALRGLEPEVTTVEARLFNHFATALDTDDPSPFRSMTYRQDHPGPLAKVAFRWQYGAVIGQGNHSVTLPTEGRHVTGDVELRHFPYRSVEHFRQKATNGLEAYRATDLPVSEGAHWRQYGEILERLGPDALDEVFREWFWFLAPCNAGMVHDAAPFMRWT